MILKEGIKALLNIIDRNIIKIRTLAIRIILFGLILLYFETVSREQSKRKRN